MPFALLVGQPQQLPISSQLVVANNRAGLRPITANTNSQIPRQPMVNQQVYIVGRGPGPQPNLLQMRSIPSQQSNHQGNGIVGVQAPIRPSSTPPKESDVSVARFLNHILASEKTGRGEHGQVIQLIQDLIDDKVSCDSFLTQLYTLMKTTRRQDVDRMFYSGLGKLRLDLASGNISLPHIKPPNLNRSTTSSSTAINPSSASQILPRPIDNLPATHTFQISTSVPISPAPPRSVTPLVQSSVYAPRVANPPIAPTTPIRPLRPAPNNQLRHKAPTNSALFQSFSGTTTPIAPQRAAVLAPGTQLRPVYPSTPGSTASIIAASSTPSISLVSAPATSAFLPVASAGAGAITSNTVSTSPNVSSQLNQPFFPVSQIRSFLATKLSAAAVASLSDEALNCMAHGLNSFLRDVLTRLSLVAGHKATKLAEDPHLEQVDYAREQIAFVQKMYDFDQEKRSELQREFILKAAKTRLRNENSEQARIREMANQLKNEKDERERQEQANFTALSAIGTLNNKRSRLSMNLSASEQILATSGVNLSSTLSTTSFSNPNAATTAAGSTSSTRLSLINSSSRLRLLQSSASSQQPSATPRFNLAASLRVRRAGLRELQVVFSKDKRLCRSRALCRTYWH
ncbi:hypothetical protein Aperf_G00000130274 [Anoplocephala perfoliata]